MRVGHAGVALAAKRFCPRVPLWLLLGAAYGPDIVELSLRAVGATNRELSHSLVSVALCATVVAGAYALSRNGRGDGGGALGLWVTYALHWPADFITGTKPTWPGGPTVGLMLYDHKVLVWIVDLAVLGAGWWIYRSRRDAGAAAWQTSGRGRR